MTPEKMLELIHAQYPTSRAFMDAVIEASNNSFARNISEPDGATDIVTILAEKFYSPYVKNEMLYNHNDNKDPIELQKIGLTKGLQIAGIVVSVYSGLVTMVGPDGKYLDNPAPITKNK